jgi:farnesyl diphosphate synthase
MATSRDQFVAVYAELRDEILADAKAVLPLPEVEALTRAFLEHNVPGGKLNRGLTVMHTLEALRGRPLAAVEVRAAGVLGWAIEWLQASFLVADDIMDASITRRGAPCWYKLPSVGMIAINDAFLLQSHLTRMLRKQFSGEPYYVRLLELFADIKWYTELGQMLDLTTSPLPGSGGALDLGRFTMERYRLIVKHKTAYYSFLLPVLCGLILGGAPAEAVEHPLVPRVLLAMGEYFQVQDDYLDAYAPPEVLGKIGTDIEDAKCSWLVVVALQRASAPQREALHAHYGRHGEEHVAAVKALYAELKLEEAFLEYEAASHAELTGLIATAAGSGVPAAAFTMLLEKIYKRAK